MPINASWLFAVLAGLSTLLIGTLVFAIVTRLTNPYVRLRGSSTAAILRIRFFLGLILIAMTFCAFFEFAPLFHGDAGLQLASKAMLLIAAIWIVMETLAELFLHRLLSGQLGAGIPSILLDVVKGVLYITVVIVVLHEYLEFNLGPFLATSAIFTAIVGLAFQDTLGNVISGLALHFASPYRVGDWIQVGGIEGKILRIDWRSTLIATRTNDSIVVPHVNMAKNEIYNFSVPSPRHAREVNITLDYAYPPDQVIDALKRAAAAADGILTDPPPKAYIQSFKEGSTLYGLWVWIDDFENLPDIIHELSRKIWYSLGRAELSTGSGAQRISVDPREKRGHAAAAADFFHAVPMFDKIEDGELERLASISELNRYGDGENIIREGDSDHDFFILFEGAAVAVKNGEPFYEYGPGEFFGEMALLTGNPRAATIRAKGEARVMRFRKKVLAPFLEANPAFLQKLSDAIGERMKTLPPEVLSSVGSDGEMRSESIGTYILRRIKNFFLQD